jgi:hypothetical protein
MVLKKGGFRDDLGRRRLDGSKNAWLRTGIDSFLTGDVGEVVMAGQPGFFDTDERLKMLLPSSPRRQQCE